MFDYTSIVGDVRRLIGDSEEIQLDETESTSVSSKYFSLSQEGYATILPSGLDVNGTVLGDGDFTVTKNVIRFPSILAAGSSVSCQYSYVSNTDAQIMACIGDVSRNVVLPLMEYDFAFGVDVPASGYADPATVTMKDPDGDYKSLLVVGAGLQILNVQLLAGGADAILIKDGDTTIDTGVSSRESAKSVDGIKAQWNELVKRVRHNHARGVAVEPWGHRP